MTETVAGARSACRGGEVRDLFGHRRKVQSVAWNCSGTHLASGSVDMSARIWDVEHHVQVRTNWKWRNDWLTEGIRMRLNGRDARSS